MNYTELCENVTNSIIEALKSNNAGTWSAPWNRIGAGWAPRNAKTEKYYGGSNVISLASEALQPSHPTSSEYLSPWWSTYNQWSDLGGQVRKGERSTSIVKWVPKAKKKNGTEEPAPPPPTPDGKPMNRLHGPQLVPKVYGVFNVAQIDGWEPPTPAILAEHTPVNAAEAWIASSGADIRFGFDHACYSPSGDLIEVPGLGQYEHPLDHYSTVCHELVLSERCGDDAFGVDDGNLAVDAIAGVGVGLDPIDHQADGCVVGCEHVGAGVFVSDGEQG